MWAKDSGAFVLVLSCLVCPCLREGNETAGLAKAASRLPEFDSAVETEALREILARSRVESQSQSERRRTQEMLRWQVN